MKFNYINFGVLDVVQVVDIFGYFFGLCLVRGMLVNEKMVFLYDDIGVLLLVFWVSDVVYFRVFYIGFFQDMFEQVQVVYVELIGVGFQILLFRENYGCLIFYFDVLFGVVIEVEVFLGEVKE